VEPASPLEPCVVSPGAQQRLLDGVLGLGLRAEHASAAAGQCNAVLLEVVLDSAALHRTGRRCHCSARASSCSGNARRAPLTSARTSTPASRRVAAYRRPSSCRAPPVTIVAGAAPATADGAGQRSENAGRTSTCARTTGHPDWWASTA